MMVPTPSGLLSVARLMVASLAAFLLASGAQAEEAERWSQFADPVFQHYTPENGLPNVAATALAQDGDGFLWVGTQGGLARWDGYRFRSYKADPKDPTALPDNFIKILHVDRRGRLWIGTSAGGLARYDRHRDSFVTYAAGPGGLSDVDVEFIADDGQGGLWVGSGGGLDHLDPDTGVIRSLRHDESDPGSLPAGPVWAVLHDRGGTLWVGTRTGIVRQEADGEPFIPVPLGAPQGKAISVTTLFEDDKGRIWIGTSKNGAYIVDPADAKARPIEETETGSSGLRSDFVSDIAAGVAGEIWIGTQGDGVIAVDMTTGRTRHIRHAATLPSSLAHDTVWALLRDRTGTVWVANNGGLDRLASGDDAILTLFGGSNRENGITGTKDIMSVRPMAGGRIWFGLVGGGIDIVDSAGVPVTSLYPDSARPEAALPNGWIYAMDADNTSVYVGTFHGVYRTNRSGTGLVRVAVPERNPLSAAGALLVDGNSLWIGGNADGLWKTSIGHGGLSLLDHWGSDRLTDVRISAIQRGTANDLWVGTLNGLNRLDLATGLVERIQSDPSDPAALPLGGVSALLFDTQGRLWIGMSQGGIAVLVGRNGDGKLRFRRLSVAEGLPDANVDMLLRDKRGKIWASTDDGLAVIDPANFAVRALHRAEGVAICCYLNGSGATTDEGELLFGGFGGVTVVRPERLKDWSYRPPVVVTDIRIDGRPVPAGRFTGVGSATPLVLTPAANSVAIEFSALDYTAPERNRYAYRLEGFDETWVETDPTRRLAAYTNLPPGSYTLHLRGSNRDGVWTEKTLDLPIQVLPAWYQTLWFKLALAGASLAAIVALVQTRTAYLRQRQRELEHQIELRTAEVVQQKEGVELAHRNISLLSEIGREITASLDPEAIMRTLYRQIEQLMDVSVLGIGLYHPDREVIEFPFVMELGKRYVPYTRGLKEPNQLAVWCVLHRQEVFINDLANDYVRYTECLEDTTADLGAHRLEDGTLPVQPVALIYVPLLVKDRVLGLIGVQSFKAGVYAPMHLDMLRTLAAYAAVALDNADAYRDLQHTQAKLVQQEKLASLGQLVAGVAHEVNTPVGVALAASTQITDEVDRFDGVIASGQLPRAELADFMATLRELAELLARNCLRAGGLIQSFKAVAADRGNDERRRFDLRAYVEDIVKTLEPTLNQSQVTLRIEGDHRPSIDSYPGVLSQVIINLVTNALTHAFEPERAGVITIRVGLRDAAHAEVIISDDGKGIAPEVLPKIFDPFFTTRRGSGGTGLGLHIVHNLVTGPLAGSISVESAPAAGTAFLIVLPINELPETA